MGASPYWDVPPVAPASNPVPSYPPVAPPPAFAVDPTPQTFAHAHAHAAEATPEAYAVGYPPQVFAPTEAAVPPIPAAMPAPDVIVPPQVPAPDLNTPTPAPAAVPKSTALVSPWIRWALLVVAVAVAAYVVIRPGANGTPEAWQQTATDVIKAAATAPETVRVNGGYLPDRGLVFSADLDGVAPKDLNPWLLTLLKPRKGRLRELPAGETVVWQVEVKGTTSGDYSRLVLIPRRAADDPSQWVSTTTTGSAGTATTTPKPSASPAQATPSPKATS
ncbi:hypothetical protein [Actinoplanes sp. NPDC049681]|uniref:hypothetical protein n=1 Tax=Actinoplanes sp. NPDC049681 TaxID=3363905 RepID=UPI0037944E9A